MTTDQEEFLRAFHAAHPSVTVQAMAHGRAEDGRSSYEILRDRVSACDRVLDLGCGDGLLLELLAEREGAPGGSLPGSICPPRSWRWRAAGRASTGPTSVGDGRNNYPSERVSSMAVCPIWR
ncbi:methionine biosynthesis protein MetW [Streptomyces sioyaensis]|uniref:methionine biosynthesis protein MetW n=1 Tax=Streptomyces sioyaensis TaxID=67364 RepID=UPI0037B1B945